MPQWNKVLLGEFGNPRIFWDKHVSILWGKCRHEGRTRWGSFGVKLFKFQRQRSDLSGQMTWHHATNHHHVALICFNGMGTPIVKKTSRFVKYIWETSLQDDRRPRCPRWGWAIANGFLHRRTDIFLFFAARIVSKFDGPPVDGWNPAIIYDGFHTCWVVIAGFFPSTDGWPWWLILTIEDPLISQDLSPGNVPDAIKRWVSYKDRYRTRWWFQIFFMFTPTWGNDPIWLLYCNMFQMGWNHQLEKVGEDPSN